jgi:hypothetical protein
LKENEPIQHCSNCKGDLCNNCVNNHSFAKPNHKVSTIEYVLPKDLKNSEECP